MTNLEPLFIRFLNMSLAGSAVILAVLFLRLFLKKAPKIFSYCLWAAVLLRLLCPVSFSASFSPFNMLKASSAAQGRMEFIPQDLLTQPRPDGGRAVLEKNEKTDSSRLETAAAEQTGKTQKTAHAAWLIKAGTLLWIFGIIILMASNAVSFLKLKRKLKNSIWVKENIYTARGITTPFVTGIFRPVIYLPFYLTAEEKEYVLLHEQIHLKRGDHVIKLLSFLALCLHWFNPLVWAAFFLSGKDMEMSCDEAVIRRIGNEVKKEYSSLLLSMATGKTAINGMPLAFGEGDPAGRIKNILHYKKPASATVKCTALICAAAVVILLADPSEKADAGRAGHAGNKAVSMRDASVRQNLAESQNQREKQGLSKQQNQPDSQKPSNSASDSENAGTAEGFLSDAAHPDRKLYSISVRSISRSARAVDSYVPLEESPFADGEAVAFDNGCQFLINDSMNGRDYREVSFEIFASFIEQSGHYLNKPCLFGMEDSRITYAALESAWYHYGITPLTSVPPGGASAYDSLAESAGEAAFYKQYSLVSSQEADIADSEGMETIEVYTKNDGESGAVLFKDAHGRVLASQDADTSRAGWNNIYLGSDRDQPFLLNVHIEDRWNYGVYGYWVYRLDKDGGYLLAKSSEFEFRLSRNSQLVYDDAVFRSWAEPMEYYLKNSRLLLSSQDDEIRTEKMSDADRYNYAALSLKDRILELNGLEGGMLLCFDDSWYGRDSLSQETAEWLERYNSLSETDQLSINGIPYELLNLAGTDGTADAQAPAG